MQGETIYEIVVCPATKENPRNSEADVIELKDGRLLLAYTDFYAGGSSDFSPGRISGRVSENRGKTWSNAFIIQKNIAQQNVMDVSLLRLHSGEIALFYGHKNSYADSKVYRRKSFTEGESWDEAICVTPRPGYNGINNARVIQLNSDRLLAPVYHTPNIQKVKHLTSTCYFSDDNGKTWRKSKTDLDLPESGADEPGLVELKDGSVLMIIRTELGKIYKSYSHDSGFTWTNPEATALTSPSSPATIKRIPETRDLIIVWNNSLDKRVPLTVAISRDEGKTWQNFKNLESEERYSYAYASVTFVKKKVLFTYYISKGIKWTTGHWSLKLKIVDTDWLYS